MDTLNYRQICELEDDSRSIYLRKVSKVLGSEFVVKHPGDRSGTLPSFLHKESGIEFTLLPEGEFTMGLSGPEESAARKILDPPPFEVSEMRPIMKKLIHSFLISTAPVMIGQARKLLGEKKLSRYLTPALLTMEPNLNAPVYVTREDATFMAGSLGCRLPYEAEWEYACRANTTSLFPWGDALLEERELEKWLDFGLPIAEWKRNRFGLLQMFSGDWCMDAWTDTHANSKKKYYSVFVIKGGGAIFWPWQGSGEWAWCMPARRMPSTGLTAERSCAFRLVKEIRGRG